MVEHKMTPLTIFFVSVLLRAGFGFGFFFLLFYILCWNLVCRYACWTGNNLWLGLTGLVVHVLFGCACSLRRDGAHTFRRKRPAEVLVGVTCVYCVTVYDWWWMLLSVDAGRDADV